jgi:hypothetical protein
MRTVIATEAAAEDGLIKQGSEGKRIQQLPDLRGARRGTQVNMSHYSVEALKSGKRVAMLWKSYDE